MSFLSDYREYVKGTEAHSSYHLFSSLVALSTVISRRVWLEMGHFTIYPNLYVILVGPAGNRKTSAMTPAKNLVRELKLPFSAECVTKEKLVLDIKDAERAFQPFATKHPKQLTYCPMACIVTELSQFFGAGGPAMSDFLTTVYDVDIYELRTKNKGSTEIPGPYLNLLACTTPDWITMYLRADVISGGFSRRAMFVFETEDAGRVAFPELSPEAVEAWRRLVSYSKALQSVGGPFVWDPSAKEWYRNWYLTLQTPVDPMTTGYYRSKHVQLLKVAMLRAISDSPDLVLRIEHLEAGLDILSVYERNLHRVFMGIGRNELNGVASKILNTVEGAPTITIKNPTTGKEITTPGLPEKKIYSAHFHDGNRVELDQCITHLVSAGRLTKFQQSINGTIVSYLCVPSP